MLTYTRVYAGEKLPTDTAAFDFLLVMGGPQSPRTTLAECPHFNAAAEIALIQDAIKRRRIVVGVCLGSQLLGEAYGAAVMHSPQKEIGVFPLTLTDDAAEDPIFSNFPSTFSVGHWHNDMPGLTAEAKVLAASAGCPRQIVRYAKRVYGLQCHMEFTREAIAGLIAHGEHELIEAGKQPFIEDAKTLLAHDYSEMNARLFQFLDAVVML